jgi:VCBS repeat-containing protein
LELAMATAFRSPSAHPGKHGRRQRTLSGRGGTRRLAFESLEGRLLLAAKVALRYEFADTAGHVVGSLRVGDDFTLRAYVADIQAVPEGIWQAYFNVNYTTAYGSANGAITHGAGFKLFASGDLRTGQLHDVGGLDSDQVPSTPKNAESLLFTVPFRANSAGTFVLTTALSDNIQYSHYVEMFDHPQIHLALSDIAVSGNSIVIAPANHHPVAAADSYSLAEGGALVTTDPTGLATPGNSADNGVLANDSDSDGNPLTATILANPSHGTVALNANGTFVYAHDGSEGTTDSFTYTVSDGQGGSATGTVTITIQPANDPPVITAPATLTAGQDADAPVTGISVADPDAGTAQIQLALSAGHATVTVRNNVGGGVPASRITGNGTGTVTMTGSLAEINATLSAAQGVIYHSAPGYAGPDSLTLTANDLGNSGSGGTRSNSKSVSVSLASPIQITDNSGSSGDLAIQFTTPLGRYRKDGNGNPLADSQYVRPACPDVYHWFEVRNTSAAAIVLTSVQVQAADVSVTWPMGFAAGMTIGGGEVKRFALTYAPSKPALTDNPGTPLDDTKPALFDFNLPSGIVVVTGAGTFNLALKGASTFNSDVNYDGMVSLPDLGALNVNYGRKLGDANYDPTGDINGDGLCALGDLGPLNVEFGRSRPSPALAAASAASAPAESAGSVAVAAMAGRVDRVFAAPAGPVSAVARTPANQAAWLDALASAWLRTMNQAKKEIETVYAGAATESHILASLV